MTFAIKLKDKALGRPNKNIREPIARTALCLLHPLSSTKYATTTSNNEIDDVNAATVNRTKNNNPKI